MPATNVSASHPDATGDLKVTDLRDPFQNVRNPDDLMDFRILTYSISPEAVDSLSNIYNRLSREDIRCTQTAAFGANGFSAGIGTFRQGSEIARTLSQIGAVRTAQTGLNIPIQKTEIFSRAFLPGTESLYIADSTGHAAVVSMGPGTIGWVISAKPDPRLRGMAQVVVSPAFWQQGFEDIRLLMGKEPTDFQFIEAGRFLARIEEGGFIVLGPSRSFSEENTLGKRLFFIPERRPRLQFFVIICDSVGPR